MLWSLQFWESRLYPSFDNSLGHRVAQYHIFQRQWSLWSFCLASRWLLKTLEMVLSCICWTHYCYIRTHTGLCTETCLWSLSSSYESLSHLQVLHVHDKLYSIYSPIIFLVEMAWRTLVGIVEGKISFQTALGGLRMERVVGSHQKWEPPPNHPVLNPLLFFLP